MHTDIVVLDKEGTHMYGRIPTEPSGRLKDILQEGNVYLIKRFMCKQSKPTYRAVDNPYMMQFTPFSTVDPTAGDEEDFPYCTYSLMPFSDIPLPGPHTPRFIDVIGRITAVTDIVVVHSEYQAEPSDTRTVVLQDQARVPCLFFLCFSCPPPFPFVYLLLLGCRGNEINLVLWGVRAHEFEGEGVHATSESGAVIAIFVGTLPKPYRGIKGLSGSYACRWYINEDLPKMNAFRASLAEGLLVVAAHIPGEQVIVPAPVCEPPVELTVRELLALDPIDNLAWALTTAGGFSHAGNAIKQPTLLEGSTVAQTTATLLPQQIPCTVCALSEAMAQMRPNLCSLIELQKVSLASHS